jgi:gliding motility-associated-like protein
MLSGAYAGVDYALASGAKIISMSWGGGGYSITYQNLFNYANSIGVTCIAAAGNSNSSVPMYPASYNHVISVGASDPNDLKASFSNFGSTVDVMAPGTGIYSTVPNSTYGFKSGTSMACPLVSGLAALMLAKSPGLSPDDLEACLKSSSDDISSQNPSFNGLIGAGRINAFNALNCVKPINANFTSDVVFQCPNVPIQYSDLSNNNPTSWEWSFPGGSPNTSVLQNPIVSYTVSGNYDVKLIAHNAAGSDTILISNYISIGTPSATLSGNANLVSGQSGFIIINFVGSPPFDFTYSDGTTNILVTGINSNVYQVAISPQTTTNYSLVSMTGNGCSGSVQGGALVTIVSVSNCGGTNGSFFTKTFGNTTNHTIKSIANTQDGGVIILGVAPTGLGADDYVVIKLDNQYNIEWEKGIGTFGNEVPGRAQIIEDSNGNFVIAGGYSTSSNTRYPQVIKLSPTGGVLWTRALNASGPDHYRVVLEETTGNYICFGTANYAIASSDFLVTRFDVNGNVLLSKAYGKGGNDHIFDAKLLANGNIAIVGTEQIAGLNRSGTLTILDNNLNIVSNQSYNPGSALNQFHEIIVKQNGNLILIQEDNSSGVFNIVISEVDNTGALIWCKKYANASNKTLTGAILLNNGVIAINYVSENVPNYITSVFTIDDFGNVVWSKSLSNSTNIADNYNQKTIALDLDGSILVGGNRKIGSVTQMALSKINQCGDLFCGESTVLLTETSLLNPPSSVSFSTINYGTLKTVSLSDINLAYTETLVCDTAVVTPVLPGVCTIDANFVFSNFCHNDSVYFSETSTNSNGSIVFWNWNFGDGSSSGGTADVAHLYSGPGPFNVQLIVGTDSSCFDTINQVVNLTNNPSIVLNDSSICIYDSIEIQPDLNCFFGELTYSWSPTLGLSDPNVLNPIASPAITTTYTLSVADTSGAVYTESIIVTVDQNCCKSYPDFDIPYSVCLGDSVLINNTSQPQGVASYSWSFGVNASSQTFVGSTPPAVLYLNTGSQDILLVLSDDCGIDSILKPVFIEDLPLVEIREDTTVCDTMLLNMGNVSVGNLGYSWQPSISVSDPTISNPSATINQSSTYYLEVTDLFTGCKNIDSVHIEFIERSIGFDITDEICLGDSVIINNTSQPHGVASYSWDFDVAASPQSFAGSAPPNVLYSNAGSHSILLVLSDDCGIDSVSKPIFIEELPIVEIREDTTVCDTMLLNMGNVSVGNLGYSWQPSISVSDPTISNPSATINQSSTYYLEVTDLLTGCKNIDSVHIEFIERSIGFDITDEICLGDSLEILNTSNSLDTATFNWNFGLGSSPMTSNQENPSNIGYAFSGSKEILLIISDQCGIDSLTQLFIVNDLPNVSIIEDTLICPLTTINIGGAGSSNNTYTWEPSVLMSNSNISNPSVSLDSSELFTVVVANTVTGCVNLDSVVISTQEELPQINLFDTVVCQGDSALIVLDQVPGTNYYWEPNGHVGNNISITEEGVYIVTVSNICNSNSDTLTVEAENCKCTFTVPNIFTPNNDDVNDGFSILKSEHCSLDKMQIYNRWGQLIFDDKNKVYFWDGRVMSGKEASEGTYYYIITIDNINYSGHFLLTR